MRTHFIPCSRKQACITTKNKNQNIWAQAKTLQEAKRQIEQVRQRHASMIIDWDDNTHMVLCQFSTQSRIAPQHLRGGRLEPEFTVEKVLITRENVPSSPMSCVCAFLVADTSGMFFQVNLFIAEAHLVGSNGEPFKH